MNIRTKASFTVIGAVTAFCALLSSPPASAQTFQLQSADLAAGQPIPRALPSMASAAQGRTHRPR